MVTAPGFFFAEQPSGRRSSRVLRSSALLAAIRVTRFTTPGRIAFAGGIFIVPVREREQEMLQELNLFLLITNQTLYQVS